MNLGLGVDTGGTYTDSVIVNLETNEVLSAEVEYAIDRYSVGAKRMATESGAGSVEIKVQGEDVYAHVRNRYGRDLLLETRLTTIAMGNPRFFS